MDDKVYTPVVISDAPFPTQPQQPQVSTSPSANGVYTHQQIPDTPMPMLTIAHELISNVLNTKNRKILAEFQFTKMGAIQIGDFEEGQHGEVRISPDGITARNVNGEVTFDIDGDTGDATFKGTIQAGSVISEGEIDGGSININNKFIVDSLGNIIIQNQESTKIMDVLYDDLKVEILNLDLGKPGTGAGQLQAYTDGNLYAYLNPDEGLVLLSQPLVIGGTGAPEFSPITHQASIYVDQSGGKDRLMVVFSSGAAQQLAIQP